jgi:hypothetical protein
MRFSVTAVTATDEGFSYSDAVESETLRRKA